MTTKEAIHFAECLKNNWTINFNDLEDFCDMAIEALGEKKNKNAEPIPQWRGCMDECLPYYDGREVQDEHIN